MNTISVEVDIDDILNNMDSSEKEDLFKELLCDLSESKVKKILLSHENKKSSHSFTTHAGRYSLLQYDFIRDLSKLNNNYLSLQQNEIDIIQNLSKKF